MSKDFHAEVEKLRTWLQTNRWADAYDGWWREGGVVSALDDFLARVAPQDWSESDVTDLLYLLEQSSTDDTIERVSRPGPEAGPQADKVVSYTLPPMVTSVSFTLRTLYRNHGCAAFTGVPKSQSVIVTSRIGRISAGWAPL